VLGPALFAAPPKPTKARIAITLDLEMSAQYPKREITEWNYEKGNLDEATKQYSVAAAKLAKEQGGVIHFFCVGRVLEHPSVEWLQQIAAEGHPIGNHTYDHVNVKATKPEETQFRFQRAPWLVEGLTAREIIDRNIRLTTKSLKARAGIEANGFRTPGGFHNGLSDKPEVQQMLLEQGFTWVSSKYPSHLYGKVGEIPTAEVLESIVKAQVDAQPFVYPSGLIEVPMSPISDVGAFRSTRWSLDSYLQAIRLAIEWAIENRAVFDLLVHPSCLVVEDPEFKIIRLICGLVRAAGDRAEIVTLDRIAADRKPGMTNEK
jgi:peptidoglycan/xylan/chitin deacetylase (PgdA/CDA1 family)